METSFIPKLQIASQRPNFPSFRHEGYSLEVVESWNLQESIHFVPLRPRSESGRLLSVWELQCRNASGELAGGCAIALPPGRGDSSSPRQLPHPVVGEWISALRYTGLNWLECGPVAVAPGFPEEDVVAALWEGLSRLMARNDVSFLIGIAQEGSLELDMALRRKSRVLEPLATGPTRYFLYVE